VPDGAAMLEGSTMSDNPAQDTSAQDALVMLMVMVSASDRAMKDEELAKIGEIVSSFPVFNGYSHDRLVATAETASLALSEEDGLESVVEAIAKAIPERLRDTAYACGVEVAAADLALRQEELRMLQMLRDALELDKLTVAALERSAMARYRGL
jgi:tellurite resistance protein